MSKLRFNISMSLDGFVAGPDPSEQEPLGKRGEELHEWVFPLAAFRKPHGDEGGEVNASTPVVEGWWENVGAFIMGRNMFGGGPGPWGEPPWQGWWGDEPPFHEPGVRAHAPRRASPWSSRGTTFHFVTDGIESALEQARDAAGGKDVSIAGGANVAQQYLAAGLIDELEIAIVPILLGGGTRLFENVGDAGLRLNQLQAVEAPGVVHLKYGVES